jgi:RNA polymerase sigma-70 factor (ECF subfamily)
MADPPFDSAQLNGWLDRIRAGDPAARDELLRACQGRLEHLARRMLRRYPTVRRWADTGDVFQGAALRLLRSLYAVPVADTRGFLNLAAANVRRELLDLARHFGGPRGVGANHASNPDGPVPDRPAADPDPADLDRWAAFHAAVDRLPADEREVFGLTYYHGWPQARIAALCGVDERTVRRRWRRAAEALHALLGGDLPE